MSPVFTEMKEAPDKLPGASVGCSESHSYSRSRSSIRRLATSCRPSRHFA